MKFKIQKRELIPKQITGLGDVVAMVAEPVKRKLIGILPNNLANQLRNCNCNKRRQTLNDLVAFTD